MEHTFNSFEEFGNYMNSENKTKQQKSQKEMKCRVCGSPMKRIEGTNLVVCTGVKVNKEGNKVPCKNYILFGNN